MSSEVMQISIINIIHLCYQSLVLGGLSALYSLYYLLYSFYIETELKFIYSADGGRNIMLLYNVLYTMILYNALHFSTILSTLTVLPSVMDDLLIRTNL